MKYVDRSGNIKGADSSQDKLLKFMYKTIPGRMLIRLLVHPMVSKAGKMILSSGISRMLIRPFVRANNIDLSLYEKQKYLSYNDFFIRRIKKEHRPVRMDPHILISPCDAKLSVYEIRKDRHFFIKNTFYSLDTLLRDKKLAAKYRGGHALLFRLTVDDYHRYCYIDKGLKTRNRYIQGVLHTVNPVANDICPIYKQNSREYSLLRSEHFGMVLMMEVGALMVGKIVNYHQAGFVQRGEEKGRFEFGGSTVILLFQKDTIRVDEDIIKNSENGYETIVKLGEKIGEKR